MLINEICKITNLTKKAIEYYTDQGLVNPVILENGYRDFNEDDEELLKKIAIFRKLGLSTEEIKAVLADKTESVLKKIAVQKELHLQSEQVKKTILGKLCSGKSYDELSMELKALEQGANVTEKLLEAFPGYYGRFICLHFARFLNEPITSEEQQSAYEEIITFLDNAPLLVFPEELQEFFNENTKKLSTVDICSMLENTKLSIENPDKYLSENKEIIEEYINFKQSEEYKNSSACKIQDMLKVFNATSGYYDTFIPAMKKLSSSYSEYNKQLEIANEKFLSQYPEIVKLSNSYMR